MKLTEIEGEPSILGVNDSPLAVAMTARAQDTMSMVRDALAEDRVLLAYQPVMAVGGGTLPAFYEGLVRILDPQGRIIPARDFIEKVETTELGRQIDCAALRIGLEALAKTPALRLSVNMSARSIGYPRWREILDAGLAADPTIGERLILEITESSAMIMPELVSVFMRELQSRSIAFALDDFGAGYTSFRYLRDFYFDILKIDGQFITGIHDSPDNQVLTTALISIARHFDMFTVAENVEGPEDAALLQQMGIDCMQGYYFGAPSIHPPWEVPDWMQKTA